MGEGGGTWRRLIQNIQRQPSKTIAKGIAFLIATIPAIAGENPGNA
jgi:hypothetical protein